MGRRAARRAVTRIDLTPPGSVTARPDTLVVEEPLELRIGGRPFTVTMRTPGDDVDLAHGFLLAEGLIDAAEEIAGAIHCAAGPGENTYNVLDLTLTGGRVPPPARVQPITSACGVCGTRTIEELRVRLRHEPAADPTTVDAAVLAALPERLRAAQELFERTGGLHAAGLFTATGELVAVREDVGRHNAVDKVLGAALRSGAVPLRGHVLLVSGRASFELVQKAAVAGVPVLAAVSAPSTLAVDLAADAGLTLVGFLRGMRMNVYTRADRVGLSRPVRR